MLRSAFIYGYQVLDDYKNFYFNEGAGVVTFAIDVKTYSLEEIRLEIQSLMTETGTQDYTVTVDRKTRKFTISAASSFELLPSETTFNLFSVLGYDSDVSGTSLTGEETGAIYYPPFPLENYLPFGKNNIAINGRVKTAPSGVTRATDFGTYTTMSCDLLYIADGSPVKGSPIRSTPTTIADTEAFMDFCIYKGRLEFFEDENDLTNPEKCFLLSTKKDKNGLGYELERMKGLYQIYKLTSLEFRKV